MPVSIKISGTEQTEVEVVTTAVAYGLNKCGFNNVEVISNDDLAITDPSENTPEVLAAMRQENPDVFNAVIDIEADVVEYLDGTPEAAEANGNDDSIGSSVNDELDVEDD